MKLFGSCAVTALETTLAGFNSQHPEITVAVKKLGTADVKSRVFAACFVGGTGLPDIFQFQNVEMELITARFPDCAVDLTPLGFDAKTQVTFLDFKLFARRQGDRMIGMP